MSKVRILLSGIILLVSTQVLATMTTIQGNAFYYRGKMIEFHQYNDLFTFKSSVLSKMLVPQDGSFKFELNLEKEGLYLIKIGRVNAHVFIQPGDQYTLVLPEPITVDRYDPAKDVFILPEIFEAKGKLNYDITDLEKSLNQFVIDHSNFYGRSVSRLLIPLADSLIDLLNAKYEDYPDPYFRTHLHYRLATFAIQTNHGRNKVFDEYFANREPAYDHLSFANAFSLFYDEYFDYLNPIRAYRWQADADTAIQQMDYTRMIQSMQVDPHLPNKTWRELLAVTQLYELGAERKYPLPKIMYMLDSLLIRAEDQTCRVIAANAQELLNRLAPGTMAPDFEFTDLFGNISRLSEFRGRYLYIQFFDDFDPETLKEMSLIKVLKDGYGSDIAMFSISTEENIQKLKKISDEYDFEWFFAKALTPREVIEQYDLRAFPAYYYIDKDLKFIKSPASPPGAKIEKLFAKAWNMEHPNKALHFKLQPPEVEPEEVPVPPKN